MELVSSDVVVLVEVLKMVVEEQERILSMDMYVCSMDIPIFVD